MANYRQTGREDEIDRQNINKPTAGGGGNGQAVQVSDTGNVTREPVSTSGANNQAANGFQVSDTVRQAQQMLQQQMANKPGQYQSTWQGQLDEILGKILNREDFSYDLNGDALYQQYKDQYMLQGQQAMMDTMGQAAALTGGYGNSYAQTVGQQTYQGYLQQLNDRIPELYQLALDKYRMEGDALMDQYALLGAQDDRDYGRYRDGMSDYYQNLSFLTDNYRDQRDFAYGQERDQAADRQWQAQFDEAKRRYDQGFQYQQGRDEVADRQWQAQFDEAMRQYNQDFQYRQDRDTVEDGQWNQSFQYQQGRDQVSDQQWQAEFDEAKRRYDQEWEQKYGTDDATGNGSGSGPSGPLGPSGSPTGDGDYDNEGLSENQIKMVQLSLGIAADGQWDSASRKAVGGLGAKDAYDAWFQGKLGKPVGPYAEVAGKIQQAQADGNTSNARNFMNKLHPESQHDAIMRDKWGSYRQYVAYQIEHSNLTDTEKAYLISYYGIRESDTDYKNS